MAQAARMIAVEVSHDDLADILRRDAQLAELWPNLVGGFDIEADCETIIRMPPGQVTRLGGPGRLARIDDDDTLRMFDHPGKNRQPFRPIAIHNHAHGA